MKAVFIVHGEGRLSLFWAFALCCLRAVIPLARPDDLGHMDVKTRGGAGVRFITVWVFRVGSLSARRCMARCGGTGVLPVYPLNGNTMNSSIFLSLPFRRTSVCVALTSALVSLAACGGPNVGNGSDAQGTASAQRQGHVLNDSGLLSGNTGYDTPGYTGFDAGYQPGAFMSADSAVQADHGTGLSGVAPGGVRPGNSGIQSGNIHAGSYGTQGGNVQAGVPGATGQGSTTVPQGGSPAFLPGFDAGQGYKAVRSA